MKKLITLLILGTIAIGSLVSCTESHNDEAKITGASADSPYNVGSSPSEAGSAMRGTQSAAQLDSAKQAHEEYVRDTTKK